MRLTTTVQFCLGPYGAPAEDLYKYKVAMLIANGIGVTPAASLLKSVWYQFHNKKQITLNKLYFFWINREPIAFAWFRDLLFSLERNLPGDKLQIFLYLTGSQKPEDIFQIAARDQEEYDPVTALKARTHYGRPMWPTVFSKISQEIKSQALPDNLDCVQVGVFYCGPKPLAKTLAAECKEASDSALLFDFKKERF